MTIRCDIDYTKFKLSYADDYQIKYTRDRFTITVSIKSEWNTQPKFDISVTETYTNGKEYPIYENFNSLDHAMNWICNILNQ